MAAGDIILTFDAKPVASIDDTFNAGVMVSMYCPKEGKELLSEAGLAVPPSRTPRVKTRGNPERG